MTPRRHLHPLAAIAAILSLTAAAMLFFHWLNTNSVIAAVAAVILGAAPFIIAYATDSLDALIDFLTN